MNNAPASERLRIGELARLTGMRAATIRTWEARYGFPAPAREGGAVRSYQLGDVRLILEVSRLRQNGFSVPAAIEAARRGQTLTTESFFATLQARWPEFGSQVLSEPALLAISRAVEDEYCAWATRAVLFACFQRESAYRRVEARWLELARTASYATVFADFPGDRAVTKSLMEAAIGADAPLRREWTLVCDAPGFTACIAGMELPARQPAEPRLFEVLWSLDGQVVREASRAGLALVARSDPKRAALIAGQLDDRIDPPSHDLLRATSLFRRMLTYRDA